MTTNYQQIADEIRAFVESEDQTRDDHLAELAQAYADACRQVNNRLRRCGDLLHRGLRSEAIHLSQEQPDLLDMVAALDVPGLELWEGTCSMYGLAKPPRLQMEVAAELNDAYSTEEPLQSSLDELRLLVLARAPLVERLTVTRRLRNLDPDTPHWTEDAVELEQACVSTLRQDVAKVVHSDDPKAARRLAESMTSPEWVKPPPQELIDKVVAVEIRGMMQDLAHSQASGSKSKTRKCLDEIQKVSANRKFAIPSDYQREIDRTKRWLREQEDIATEREHFHDLCGQLHAAVQQDVPLAQLEHLHRQVAAFGMAMPDEVKQCFESSVHRKRLLASRAKKRNLILLGVTLIMVIAGIGLFLGKARTDSEAESWISRIDLSIGDYDFPTARKTWDQLATDHMSLSTRLDVMAAHQRLIDAELAETRRVDQMNRLLDDADSAATPAGTRWKNFDDAERIARMDLEKLKVRTLRHKWDRAVSPVATPTTAIGT